MFEITNDNSFVLMRDGRARWKIENETLNTLKNTGYNFEYNYGHGNANLYSKLIMLIMLAFLIDQMQFLYCSLDRELNHKTGPWYALYTKIRLMLQTIVWNSWQQLYRLMINPYNSTPPNWRGRSIITDS